MFDSSIHAKRKGVKTIFLLQHEKRIHIPKKEFVIFYFHKNEKISRWINKHNKEF